MASIEHQKQTKESHPLNTNPVKQDHLYNPNAIYNEKLKDLPQFLALTTLITLAYFHVIRRHLHRKGVHLKNEVKENGPKVKAVVETPTFYSTLLLQIILRDMSRKFIKQVREFHDFTKYFTGV